MAQRNRSDGRDAMWRWSKISLAAALLVIGCSPKGLPTEPKPSVSQIRVTGRITLEGTDQPVEGLHVGVRWESCPYSEGFSGGCHLVYRWGGYTDADGTYAFTMTSFFFVDCTDFPFDLVVEPEIVVGSQAVQCVETVQVIDASLPADSDPVLPGPEAAAGGILIR